jgi:hypothetical protein
MANKPEKAEETPGFGNDVPFQTLYDMWKKGLQTSARKTRVFRWEVRLGVHPRRATSCSPMPGQPTALVPGSRTSGGNHPGSAGMDLMPISEKSVKQGGGVGSGAAPQVLVRKPRFRPGTTGSTHGEYLRDAINRDMERQMEGLHRAESISETADALRENVGGIVAPQQDERRSRMVQTAQEALSKSEAEADEVVEKFVDTTPQQVQVAGHALRENYRAELDDIERLRAEGIPDAQIEQMKGEARSRFAANVGNLTAKIGTAMNTAIASLHGPVEHGVQSG